MSMVPPHQSMKMSDPSVALRKAARAGKLVRLAFLIATGGGVRFCNNSNIALLHDTIRAGQPRAAEALIKGGMRVDCSTHRGTTPLMAAAAMGEAGLVRMLVKAGADINATDIERNTALHYAASSGQIETFEELIRLGADDGLLDFAGLTAMDKATDELRAHLQTAPSLAHGNLIKTVHMRKKRGGGAP